MGRIGASERKSTDQHRTARARVGRRRCLEGEREFGGGSEEFGGRSQGWIGQKEGGSKGGGSEEGGQEDGSVNMMGRKGRLSHTAFFRITLWTCGKSGGATLRERLEKMGNCRTLPFRIQLWTYGKSGGATFREKLKKWEIVAHCFFESHCGHMAKVGVRH